MLQWDALDIRRATGEIVNTTPSLRVLPSDIFVSNPGTGPELGFDKSVPPGPRLKVVFMDFGGYSKRILSAAPTRFSISLHNSVICNRSCEMVLNRKRNGIRTATRVRERRRAGVEQNQLHTTVGQIQTPVWALAENSFLHDVDQFLAHELSSMRRKTPDSHLP